MEAAEIDRELGELEGRVEQLRSLYEQYFMGFDRLEPLVQRRDVERRVSALRREQIRNTAQRFKFNVLVQRLNTMQQHWARVVREIENGTYKRDVVRAAARFGDGALSALGKKKTKGLAAAVERAQARQGPAKEKAEEAYELEADDLIEEAEDALNAPAPPRVSAPEPAVTASPTHPQAAPPPQPPSPAPQASPTGQAPVTGKGAAPLPATLGLGLLSRLSAGAKRPEGAQPALTPTKPLIPSPTTPKIPAQPATSAAPSLAAPSPTAASPAAPSPAAPSPAAPSPAAPSPLTRPAHLAPKPVVPTKPAAPAIPKVAAPAASAPAPAPKPAPPQAPVAPPPPPVARPAAPPAAPVTMGGAPPYPPARPAARPPAPAPQPAAAPTMGAPPPNPRSGLPAAGGAAGGELAEQRIRQIYATYIDAKRSTQESTAGITYDKLAQSLRTQADRLRSAHPSKTVDYEVVVKDGKTHLKPVLR